VAQHLVGEAPTAQAPGEVTLRVVDELGAPIAGALVMISPEGGMPQPLWTADDGTVGTGKSTPGRHRLYIEASQRLHHERWFTLGAGERLALDVLLEREATLRIRVLHPDGTVWLQRPPLPELRRDGQALRRDQDFECAQDGDAIAVHGLGAVAITITSPAGDELCAGPLAVTLRQGATVTVDLPTAVGRRCTLEFGDADLRVPSVHVVVRRSSGEPAAECDAATDFTVGALRPRCDVVLLPGDYEVSGSAADGGRFAAHVTVRVEDRSGRIVAVPRAQ
jgi:hypothetical protein